MKVYYVWEGHTGLHAVFYTLERAKEWLLQMLARSNSLPPRPDLDLNTIPLPVNWREGWEDWEWWQDGAITCFGQTAAKATFALNDASWIFHEGYIEEMEVY